MRTIRELMAVEVVAIAAFFVFALLVAGVGGVHHVRHTDFPFGPFVAAQFLFIGELYSGLAPVALIGAPGYVLLLRHNRARWPYVLSLGAALGLASGLLAALLLLHHLNVFVNRVESLGILVITAICGAAVASLTHLVCRRLGPNNSFKPKPLRGSA
jgi:hypothetical protein